MTTRSRKDLSAQTKKELRDPRRAMAIRERQSVAAMVIAERFGPFAEGHPEMWTQRTFLLIVGKVYEHLVLRKVISPKEFIELTRTLVENCKADAKRQEGSSTQKIARGGRGVGRSPGPNGVVDELEHIVRQLYGTNLQGGESVGSALVQPCNEPA